MLPHKGQLRAKGIMDPRGTTQQGDQRYPDDEGDEVPQEGRGQHGMEGVSVCTFPIPISLANCGKGNFWAQPWPGHCQHAY